MTVRECVCPFIPHVVIGEFRIGDVDRLRILRKFKVQRTQPSLRRRRFSFIHHHAFAHHHVIAHKLFIIIVILVAFVFVFL